MGQNEWAGDWEHVVQVGHQGSLDLSECSRKKPACSLLRADELSPRTLMEALGYLFPYCSLGFNQRYS